MRERNDLISRWPSTRRWCSSRSSHCSGRPADFLVGLGYDAARCYLEAVFAHDSRVDPTHTIATRHAARVPKSRRVGAGESCRGEFELSHASSLVQNGGFVPDHMNILSTSEAIEHVSSVSCGLTGAKLIGATI